jgi:monoamine oxidase
VIYVTAPHDKEPHDASRRRFLGAAATSVVAMGGSSAVAVSGSRSAAPICKTPGCDYDVVVIGGGFAGVAASRDCRKNGYHTLLLEARNRLGGRTFSTQFEDTHVELGGFWIHHTQPFVWAEKERYGLEIVETPGAVATLMRLNIDGKLIDLTPAQIGEAVGGWQTFTDPGREILPRAWDLLHNREAALAADRVNVGDKLVASGLSPLQQHFARATMATMVNNKAESMSYLELLRWHQCGGGYFPTVMDSVGRFSLKDGTSRLIEKMIEDGKPQVRLSTPVKSVEDKRDRVVITTERGEKITAAVAIACLPLNTINDITFDPPLPRGVVEAGRQRHPGSGFKFYMKVKGDVGNLVGLSTASALDSVITYKQAGDHTILIGFGGNPAALDVNDDDAVQKALHELVPGAQLLSTMSYDWNNDPYSRGTWCSYRPGWVGKYYEDFNRDLGRIYFGCSDHGEGWRGFIDGAIGGGIKAARRVKDRLA